MPDITIDHVRALAEFPDQVKEIVAERGRYYAPGCGPWPQQFSWTVLVRVSSRTGRNGPAMNPSFMQAGERVNFALSRTMVTLFARHNQWAGEADTPIFVGVNFNSTNRSIVPCGQCPAIVRELCEDEIARGVL